MLIREKVISGFDHHGVREGPSERNLVKLRKFSRLLSKSIKLESLLSKTLTIETLVEIQYHSISIMNEGVENKILANIIDYLSQYKYIEDTLLENGFTQRQFFLDAGLSEIETDQVLGGELTVRDILVCKPLVVFNPIIRKFRTVH